MKDADIQLFERISENDHQAFRQLFEKFYQSLCRFSIGICHHPDNAEEAVQMVFVKLWEQRDSIRISSSVKAYLFTAVHHTTLNLLKKESNLNRDEAGNKRIYNEFYETGEEEDEEERLSKLIAAVNDLPPRCAEVFKLAKISGLKQTEVAIKLNISKKTVEAQIAKAKRILQEKLGSNSRS